MAIEESALARHKLATTRRGLISTGAVAAAAVAAPWATAADDRRSASGAGGAGGERTVGSAGLDASRVGRVGEALGRHVAATTIPGAVGLVARGGDVHVEAVGETAFEGGGPMRRDAIFRIASVTKPIVAAAAMMLVEECALRLDDPVDALLPELADRKVLRAFDGPLGETVPANRPITLRDLLTFRLGYGAIFAQTPLAAAMAEAGVAPGPMLPAFSADEYLKRLGGLPLAHQPGERWLYNTGSDVLGILIARATGTSLGTVLKERIFDPLGMKDTGFRVPAEKLGRLPAAYWTDFATGEFGEFDGAEGSRFAAPPVFESGAGGLVSTADDLLAFGEMMLGKGTYRGTRLLSRPSIELMTADHITPDQKAVSPFFPGFWDNQGWGFGVAVNTRRDKPELVPGRYGWDGGYGTSWYVDPVEGLIGIMLTQRVLDGQQMAVYADFWTTAYAAIGD